MNLKPVRYTVAARALWQDDRVQRTPNDVRQIKATQHLFGALWVADKVLVTYTDGVGELFDADTPIVIIRYEKE